MPNYYKVLDGVKSYHGGSGDWYKPVGKRPGKWMPEIVNIEPCERGYHLVTVDQLPKWIGPTVWKAEGRGEYIAGYDKHIFGQARLIEKVKDWSLEEDKWWMLEFEEAQDIPARRDFVKKTREYLQGKISKEDYSYPYYSYCYSYSCYYSSYYYSSYLLAQSLATRLGLEWDIEKGES